MAFDFVVTDLFELVARFLFGDSSARKERKLKEHQVRRVAEIKAERGQF
jgi:hypothetical protein